MGAWNETVSSLVFTSHRYRLTIVAAAISKSRVSRTESISFSNPSKFFHFTVEWYCTTGTKHKGARYTKVIAACEINLVGSRLRHGDVAKR